MGQAFGLRSTVVRVLTVLSVVTTLFVVGGEASAATLTVPSVAFPTIQSAVDAANEGDVINVKPGTYNESVEVGTNDLTIQKKPKTKGSVIVDGFSDISDDETFEIIADDFTLKNVTARNGENDTIYCSGDRCTIQKVRVLSSVSGNCISIDGEDARVAASFLRSCASIGINVDNGHGLVLRGNNIRLTDSSCIDVDGAGVLIEKNVVGQCEDANGLFLSGENPRVLNNKFSGPTDSVVVDVDCADGDAVDPTIACDTGAVNGNVITNGAEDDDGIELVVAADTGSFEVIGNTVVRTLQDGYDLTISDGVIKNNVARENGAEKEDGFVINGDDNVISGNQAIANGGAGIDIDGDDNTVSNNVASANGVDGIVIDVGDANTLNANKATGNQADGIENDGTNTVLTNNTAKNNKIDCANDGTIASNNGNVCADGSDFGVGSSGIG